MVTPNKPLVRRWGSELERLAFEKGVRLAYHDSIAAGWPLMYALERPLVRLEIVGVRAVLSSTCNVILESMTEGLSLREGLDVAVARGLTETDPDLDLSGWDSAQKLSILVTRLLRHRHTLSGMEVKGLDSFDPALARTARRLGLCVKLVAYAQLHSGAPVATVRPMAVPIDSHLGANRDNNHVVVLLSKREGEIVQMGQGAGTLPVATAVLNDLIGVLDTRHSWTGRFPASNEVVGSPVFEEHLLMDESGPVIVKRPTEDSIPVLRP